VPAIFQASVGAVVANTRGEVLAMKSRGQGGTWQLPQSALERDEDAQAAVCRELVTKTGLARTDVEL
jgi:8-oxo-dGTP pyrophosphatase MutT (NUDIX family)